MIEKTHAMSARASQDHGAPAPHDATGSFADLLVMIAPEASKMSEPATVAAAATQGAVDSAHLQARSGLPSGTEMSAASTPPPSKPAEPASSGPSAPGDRAGAATRTDGSGPTTSGSGSIGTGPSSVASGTSATGSDPSGPAAGTDGTALATAASSGTGGAPGEAGGVALNAFAALLDGGATAPRPPSSSAGAPAAATAGPESAPGGAGPSIGAQALPGVLGVGSATAATSSSGGAGAPAPAVPGAPPEGQAQAQTRPAAAPAPDAGSSASTLHLVAAMAPTPPGVPSDAVVSASSPAPGAPPTPAEQLAEVVVPYNRRPDGSYHITLKLQPEGLGDVHVAIHIQAGTIQLQIQAQGGATRDLLRQNMDDLRRQLEASGFASAQCEVGGGGGRPTGSPLPGGAQHAVPQAPDAGSETAADALALVGPSASTPTTPAPDGSLDLRL